MTPRRPGKTTHTLSEIAEVSGISESELARAVTKLGMARADSRYGELEYGPHEIAAIKQEIIDNLEPDKERWQRECEAALKAEQQVEQQEQQELEEFIEKEVTRELYPSFC